MRRPAYVFTLCRLAFIALLFTLAVFPGRNAFADTPSANITDQLTDAEIKQFGSMPLIQLCDGPDKTAHQVEYINWLKSKDIYCPRGASHFFDAGRYGYEHPSSAYCNAGNGMKTGLLGFITGGSTGNKNIITLVGTVLAMTFAGCNNAPPQQATATPTSTPNTSQPAIVVAHELKLNLKLTPTSTLAVSEPGYAGKFLATSSADSIVAIDET